MQAGDVLAKRPGGRRTMVLSVNQKDIRDGINAKTPGLYAFSGCWYGKNASTNSFGKISHVKGRVVARVRPGKRIPKLLRNSLL